MMMWLSMLALILCTILKKIMTLSATLRKKNSHKTQADKSNKTLITRGMAVASKIMDKI